jgi:hypothetical protein
MRAPDRCALRPEDDARADLRQVLSKSPHEALNALYARLDHGVVTIGFVAVRVSTMLQDSGLSVRNSTTL